MSINFEQDKQTTLTKVDDAKSLANQVLKLKSMEDDLAKKEDAIKKLKKDIEVISGEVIPTMMQEMNLSSLKLEDGSSVEVKPVYGASISIGQDIPAGGLATYPASPVTAGLGATTGELLLLGPANGAVPYGVPTAQLNGLAAASSSLTAASSAFAEGAADTTTGDVPFWTTVTSTIARADAANSMMYKVTADTTMKVFNVDAITDTSVSGDGVYISQADSDAGRAGYILGRVNYLRPAFNVSWNDIQEFIDFASQVGGNDE